MRENPDGPWLTKAFFCRSVEFEHERPTYRHCVSDVAIGRVPGSTETYALTLVVELSRGESADDLVLGAIQRMPDGSESPLFEVNTRFPPDSLYLVSIVPLEIPIGMEGRIEFDIRVDGGLLARVPFGVIHVTDAGPTPRQTPRARFQA